RRRLPLCHLLAVLRTAFLDDRTELAHRCEDPLRAVHLCDLVEVGAPPGGVGQEFDEEGLVCHERANAIRAAPDELEADGPAATVPVHVSRLVAESCQERRGIV